MFYKRAGKYNALLWSSAYDTWKIGLFLFFILPLSWIEANNLKAHTNKTSTWPNAQELKIIQDTIKNNPIEKQLEKPVRLFLIQDNKLIITKKH